MDTDMAKDRDADSGQYTETVHDEEIIAYVANHDTVGTSDVASEFDLKRPSAYRRLKTLEAHDRLASTKVGGSLIWEVSDA